MSRYHNNATSRQPQKVLGEGKITRVYEHYAFVKADGNLGQVGDEVVFGARPQPPINGCNFTALNVTPKRELIPTVGMINEIFDNHCYAVSEKYGRIFIPFSAKNEHGFSWLGSNASLEKKIKLKIMPQLEYRGCSYLAYAVYDVGPFPEQAARRPENNASQLPLGITKPAAGIMPGVELKKQDQKWGSVDRGATAALPTTPNKFQSLKSNAFSSTSGGSKSVATGKFDADWHKFLHSPDALYSQPKVDDPCSPSPDLNSSSDNLTDRVKGVLSNSPPAEDPADGESEGSEICSPRSFGANSRRGSQPKLEDRELGHLPRENYYGFPKNFPKAKWSNAQREQDRQPENVRELRGIIVAAYERNGRHLIAYSSLSGFALIRAPECSALLAEHLCVGEFICFDAKKFLDGDPNVIWLATSVEPLRERVEMVPAEELESHRLTCKVKAIVLRVSSNTAWLWNDGIGRIQVSSRAFRAGMVAMDAVECVCQYNGTDFKDFAFTATSVKLLSAENKAEANKAVHAEFGQLLVTEDQWRVTRTFPSTQGHGFGYLRHMGNGSSAFFTYNDVTSGDLLPAEGVMCRATAVHQPCDRRNTWRAVLVSALDPRSKQPIFSHSMLLEEEEKRASNQQAANREGWGKKWQVEAREAESPSRSHQKSFVAVASKQLGDEELSGVIGEMRRLLHQKGPQQQQSQRSGSVEPAATISPNNLIPSEDPAKSSNSHIQLLLHGLPAVPTHNSAAPVVVGVSPTMENGASNNNNNDPKPGLKLTYDELLEAQHHQYLTSRSRVKEPALIATEQPTTQLSKDVKQWTVEDVERWVNMATYPETSYGSKFSKEKINGPALLGLTKEDIRSEKDGLGIPLGPAVNLHTAIQKLKSDGYADGY